MDKQAIGTHMNNRDFFIHRWEMEHPAFVAVCKAVPSDKLDYRPHPSSRSAGELVALIASLERSCSDLCETGRGSYNSRLSFHPSPGTLPLEKMIDEYEQYHHAFGQRLSRIDDDTWNRAAWLTRGEQEIILKDSIGGLLWIALFDAIHHRGQLSVYIRPMGGRVPSIYGPSGDTPATP